MPRPSSPRARAAATALLVALTLAACGTRQPAPVEHYPWRPKMRVDTPPPPPVPDVPPSYMVLLNNDDGTTSDGRIGLYKAGCFVRESKQGADAKALVSATKLLSISRLKLCWESLA